MTEKQKRFAEYYAANPNATEAAEQAGFSAKTARSQGQRMLTNVDIQQYIKQLQDDAASLRIASMLQVKAFWTDVLNDKQVKMSDRLRASELLAKSAGTLTVIQKKSTEDGETMVAKSQGMHDDLIIYSRDSEELPILDADDECGCLIYMPELDSEENCKPLPEDD